MEVRVSRWDVNTNKIELTLADGNRNDDDEDIEDDTEVQPSGPAVNVGELFEATIKQSKPNGFTVRLNQCNRSAFLPFVHLSDSREHLPLLQAHYTGDQSQTISVVVISNSSSNGSNMITVSKKQSLISAAASDRMLTDATKATVGSQWLGWVSKKESYGIFIELPAGVKGLVRNKDVCDSRPMKTAPGDLFELGDTIEARLIEIDASKGGRRLFSLKMSDTYRAADNTVDCGAVAFLRAHLEERRMLQATAGCGKVRSLAIGDLVEVTISKQCEWGFTLTTALADTVVGGFVRNAHLPTESVLTEASLHRAVVIDIDLTEQAVEVAMAGSLVNAVANRKDNSSSKVVVGQNLQSDVLAFNSDFVVAALKGHGNGSVVYVPTKRFWNDVAREFHWIVKQRNATIVKAVLPKDVLIGSLAINESLAPVEGEVKVKSPVVSMKDLSKKIKIKKGESYPAYFHSITKNKLFVCITKRQKGICSLTEFSDSVNELEKLMIHPPEQFSALERQFTVTSLGKAGNGVVGGHFLSKEEIIVGDVVCCKVISSFGKHKYRMKLPFDLIGYTNMMKAKNRKAGFTPRVGNIVQCKVTSMANMSKIQVVIVGCQRLAGEEEERGDGEEEEEEDDEEDEEDAESETEEIKVDFEKTVGEDAEEDEEEDDEEMPLIVRSIKIEEGKDNLTNIYKRVHKSDDEEEEEDSAAMACLPTPAKLQKTEKIDSVKRELAIRKAEKRRETGENTENPTNESEFELLLFNNPHESAPWIRYMKFVMDTDKKVDKVRSIAERAMKTIPVRDADNRYRLMKEYVDLEIGQLVLTNEGANYDGQLVRVRKLVERGLAQKAKAFYGHVCDKLLASQLYELAEEVAKRFIKEFHHDSAAWFQLFLIRFLQKKYPVVKETITNAERSLKAADFRDLSIRMAQTEIERGDRDRGVHLLVELVEKRPKDGSLRNRVVGILDKNNLSQHVAKLAALPASC